jgi:hypothetical protein
MIGNNSHYLNERDFVTTFKKHISYSVLLLISSTLFAGGGNSLPKNISDTIAQNDEAMLRATVNSQEQEAIEASIRQNVLKGRNIEHDASFFGYSNNNGAESKRSSEYRSMQAPSFDISQLKKDARALARAATNAEQRRNRAAFSNQELIDATQAAAVHISLIESELRQAKATASYTRGSASARYKARTRIELLEYELENAKIEWQRLQALIQARMRTDDKEIAHREKEVSNYVA